MALVALVSLLGASSAAAGESGLWVADGGDGTYRNPVLYADYSDPDVVAVGEDFYLAASSFTNVPGLPILHSRDLVTWRLVGHALAKLVPEEHHSTPRRGGGVWAPCLRYRAGRFVLYYPDPDFGVFRVTAEKPEGPWSEPSLVLEARGAIDPAPFWDKDGNAWLVVAWANSRAGISNRLTAYRMDSEGTRVVDGGQVILDGAQLPPVATSVGPLPWITIEGPKVYERNGWVYVFAPAGGVKPGWQGVFRSRNLLGPYEGRNVLDQGKTEVNGPHQGAWVHTPAGEDFFVHFQDQGSLGRVVHLQPMRWVDDWPVIGADPDGDGRGEPVLSFTKPKASVSIPSEGEEHPPTPSGISASGTENSTRASLPPRGSSPEAVTPASDTPAFAPKSMTFLPGARPARGLDGGVQASPQTIGSGFDALHGSDEFNRTTLSLQWQWSANPRSGWSSLAAAPGSLRLRSVSASANLWEVASLLTQKVVGPGFTATAKLRFAPKAVGEQAGLVVLGSDYAYLALRQTRSGLRIVQSTRREAPAGGVEEEAGGIDFSGDEVLLRVEAVATSVAVDPPSDARWPSLSRVIHLRCQFSYSLNGTTFQPLGGEFISRPGRWVGAQVGLFALAPTGTPSNVATSVGYADFDWFRLTGPPAP